MREQQQRRAHIYELDPLRICTALCVVGVHVLSFTLFLNHTDIGTQIQNAFVVALHFTREVFMFVTAFAMVYVYYGRPFNFKRFWTKRGIGVLIPYAIWSIIYTWVNNPPLPAGTFTKTALLDILTGNASYQLYYILLTLQFYLILPLFLLFLKQVKNRPWIVLSISFVFQVVFMYLDYHLLQKGSLASSGFWQFIAQYQNRFVLVYQLYFILGGLTALYLQQVRAFLLRHGRAVVCLTLFALAGLWIHYVLQMRIYQEPMDYATSVLQPAMVFYSTAVIAGFFWLVSRWAKRVDADGRPKGYRIWHLLSDVSFGVYLIHALLLTATLKWVVPSMPEAWPVAIRVVLTWLITAGGATAISIVMMHIPVLSRLVGRAQIARRSSTSTPQASPKAEQDIAAEAKQAQHAL
ncbi:acyltransferase [Ktedonosporobacter rubrisoli]|uniref:acyltransferase n=1 Tax=Ktedonosporobacter rubrisoli TaxID=2509675 RepID=UPI0013EE4FF9|nr:acyltransferase [Ktedonosporobacter rubrisoli]